MRNRTRSLSAAAVAAMFAIAGPGGSALAVPESGVAGRSSAEIDLTGCLLESSKEISYVEYLSGGTALSKDEAVDSETLDLSTVEGIEDVDAVEVKAGTTVESFAVSCAEEPVPADTAGEEDTDDGRAGTRGSGAVIALEGCVVESSKDISYVEFLADGQSLWKDESMNSESFDLATVEGIEDVDAVEVKSSTTVESFDVACGEGATVPDDAAGSEDDLDDTDGDGDTDGDTVTDAESAAVISLNGCIVESTKDISYVEFLADGQSLWKDESMNSESFDLATVEGIEDVDAVEVKSSTTVASFAVSCGDDSAAASSGSADDVEEADSDDADSDDADSAEDDADQSDDAEDSAAGETDDTEESDTDEDSEEKSDDGEDDEDEDEDDEDEDDEDES